MDIHSIHLQILDFTIHSSRKQKINKRNQKKSYRVVVTPSLKRIFATEGGSQEALPEF